MALSRGQIKPTTNSSVLQKDAGVSIRNEESLPSIERPDTTPVIGLTNPDTAQTLTALNTSTHEARATLAAVPLPFEIWSLISAHLSQQDQRSWLSISRIHHNVVLPLVFRSVRLTFGFISKRSKLNVRYEYRTKRFLDRVIVDNSFANLLKSLTIEMACRGVGLRLQGKLLTALTKMKSLVSFAWDRGFLDLDEETVRVLARSMPSLRHLSISGKHFRAFGLQAVRNLQSISILISTNSTALRDDASQLIFNNQSSIRSLEVGSAPLIQEISSQPGWAIQNLHHLALTNLTIESLPILDAILSHTTSLKSLKIKICVGLREGVLSAGMFRRDMHALPALRYFTAQVENTLPVNMPIFYRIGWFASDRTSLERLHLGSRWNSLLWVVGEVGASLTGLKVLSIHSNEYFGLRTTLRLPTSLEVLKYTYWGYVWEPPQEGFDVASAFLELPNLRALFVSRLGKGLWLDVTNSRRISQKIAEKLPEMTYISISKWNFKVARGGSQVVLEDLDKIPVNSGENDPWDTDPISWVLQAGD